MSPQGVGEPPLFLAASVFFAIKAAVAAARREGGVEGHFQLDSPATCERIRLACSDHFTQQVLICIQGVLSFMPENVRSFFVVFLFLTGRFYVCTCMRLKFAAFCSH